MTPIVAKASNESKFPKLPLPETGTVQGVCCGVWDIGLQKSNYKGVEKIKHQIVVAWEIDQLIDVPESEYNGKPYMLSKTYTLSLYENSNLRKDLESWRGKQFSEQEVNSGFDVSTLYGINCMLGIVHKVDERDASKVYANMSSILPPMRNMKKMIPVRAEDEPAPKWVLEKKAAAVQEQDVNPFDAPFEPAGPDVGDGDNIGFA